MRILAIVGMFVASQLAFAMDESSNLNESLLINISDQSELRGVVDDIVHQQDPNILENVANALEENVLNSSDSTIEKEKKLSALNRFKQWAWKNRLNAVRLSCYLGLVLLTSYVYPGMAPAIDAQQALGFAIFEIFKSNRLMGRFANLLLFLATSSGLSLADEYVLNLTGGSFDPFVSYALLLSGLCVVYNLIDDYTEEKDEFEELGLDELQERGLDISESPKTLMEKKSKKHHSKAPMKKYVEFKKKQEGKIGKKVKPLTKHELEKHDSIQDSIDEAPVISLEEVQRDVASIAEIAGLRNRLASLEKWQQQVSKRFGVELEPEGVLDYDAVSVASGSDSSGTVASDTPLILNSSASSF